VALAGTIGSSYGWKVTMKPNMLERYNITFPEYQCICGKAYWSVIPPICPVHGYSPHTYRPRIATVTVTTSSGTKANPKSVVGTRPENV
jgi:hypothetical protein